MSALTAETRPGKRAAATIAAAGDTSKETAAAAGSALALAREEAAAGPGRPVPTHAARPVEAEDIAREATLPREANLATAAEAEATAAATHARPLEVTRGPSPPKSRPLRATVINVPTERGRLARGPPRAPTPRRATPSLPLSRPKSEWRADAKRQPSCTPRLDKRVKDDVFYCCCSFHP